MAESKLVIGLAGRIGSGKTTIAHLLETEFGFQYLRYSLVLAEWFQTEPSAKTVLQRVGWDVMSGDRQRELNRRLIQQISRDRDCVVDGLRHPIDFESLKAEFSLHCFLLYIDAPTESRFERLHERYATHQEFAKADLHPVESNIELLRPLASAFLDGTVGVEQLALELRILIRDLRSAVPGQEFL